MRLALTERQKEVIADWLLGKVQAGRDPDYPAFSEAQLAKKTREEFPRDPRPGAPPDRNTLPEQGKAQESGIARLDIPVGYRALVAMRMCGFTYREIGEEMGISHVTVLNRLRRLRDIMRAERQ